MTLPLNNIRRSSPAIGAELENIDLSRPLDDEGIYQIRRTLLDNLVIFFRNQQLSADQQKRLARGFRGLHIHPAPLGVLEGHPEVLIIKADENSKRIAGQDWHSDVSCDAAPPLGTILYMKEVPEVGGDTLFASMYAAYEALSDAMQRFLAGLTAIHDGGRNYAGRQPAEARSQVFPCAEHTVVRTHPENWTPGLVCQSLVYHGSNSSNVRAITFYRCFSGTSRTPNSNAVSVGNQVRWRSGIIDARNTWRSGTTIRNSVMARG